MAEKNCFLMIFICGCVKGVWHVPDLNFKKLATMLCTKRIIVFAFDYFCGKVTREGMSNM